jgi:hypothetical protein
MLPSLIVGLTAAAAGLVSATPFYKMDPSKPWRKELAFEPDMQKRQSSGTDACAAIAGKACKYDSSARRGEVREGGRERRGRGSLKLTGSVLWMVRNQS